MTAPLPVSEADAVVIGAGAFGYATAYFLARHGAGRVVLLDKGTPGDGSSARAAGLFKMVQADEVMTRLSHRSAAIVRGFAAETGIAIPYHDSGSILAARGAGHAPLIRAEIAQSLGWGVELDVVDAGDVRRLAPWLDGDPFEIAVHVRGDMYVEEPPSVLDAFHRAAEKLGVAIVGDAPVTTIRAERGRVAGVTTPRGEIAAPIVVDAAGAWARMLGQTANTEVAMAPVRHQLAISLPVAGIAAAEPILRLIDVSAYLRPCRGGLMYGGFEADPAVIAPPADRAWSIGNLEIDANVPAEMAGRLATHASALREVAPSEVRGGLLTMTPDGRFLAGPSPDLAGLWLNTGCNGSGFSFAPAIGEALAGWIIAGEPAVDMATLDPRRFPARLPESELAARGVYQYANYYGAIDPSAVVSKISW